MASRLFRRLGHIMELHLPSGKFLLFVIVWNVDFALFLAVFPLTLPLYL